MYFRPASVQAAADRARDVAGKASSGSVPLTTAPSTRMPNPCSRWAAVYTRGIGIPTYGVGAGFIKDSDDFMHGLNERVPVKSFYDYLDFWYVLVKNLAGTPSTQ